MKLILSAGAVLSAMALSSPAAAHAFLDHAAPAVGSTVRGSPAEVRLWFTQELEPAFSNVRVLDAAGRRVDRGDKALDPGNRTVLRVSLPALPPGTYTVTWRVLSVDTHTTDGSFTFSVAP